MKQFSNLLQQLLSKQNTPFVQKLISSSIMINNSQILMSDILYLIECFEGFGPECNGIYLTGQEYLQQFFKTITPKPLQGFIAIKIALTLHLILYEFQIGEIVAEEMIRDGHSIHIVQNQGHSQFVQNYIMYLMKLAQNLKLFYACKIGQYPIFDQEQTFNQYTESTRENQVQQFNQLKKQSNFRDTNIQYRNYQQKKLELHLQQSTGYITVDQKILFLFKLHNLLNQCVQILNLSVGVLSQIDKQDYKNIYIEISCVLWNDTMVMYKFATQEVQFQINQLCKLLDSFRYMPLQQLLSLQQIYWATIDSTKSIKWIFTNRKYFDTQNIVKLPYWFEENIKLTKELHNSIIDNKISSIPETSRHFKIQTPKAQFIHKSPTNINQPYSSRVGNANSKPYFVAHKKLQSISKLAPQSENRDSKPIVGSIFSDEQLQMSPRDTTKKS